MPGGFENSAMKSSFSLSSLQPSSASLESPENARPERPYNSLRKTCRKDPDQEMRRRSWDRKEVTKEEFWNALEPNYLYLMDSNLIDSCKEARQDLQYGTSPIHDWSFDQFCTQFTELDHWLTSIQETLYSKEENVTDRKLRLMHVEEMHRKTNKRKLFNNQGGRLAARFPDLKDEVKWRMAHLNRKWERLEQTVTPRKRPHPEHLTHAIVIEHELNCLRKWLRLTDRRLPSINFRASWTLSVLEAKAKEHQAIQREVELHGKIVRSVLKRCDRLVQVEAETGIDSSQAIKVAYDLERRWQCLYLRSLEWLCYIENQTKLARTKGPAPVTVVESDEGEPVLKYPRLSSSPWPGQHSSIELHGPAPVTVVESDEGVPVLKYPRLSSSPWPAQHSSIELHDDDGDYLMDVSTGSAAEMVGTHTELDLKFPTTFDPSSVMSPPSPSLLNRSGSMQISTEEDINENYPSLKTSEFNNHIRHQRELLDTARKLFPDETSVFTQSNRPGKNLATYYFKHPDTESEREEVLMETDAKNSDISSEEDEDWTYTGKLEEDSPAQNDDSSLCHSTETLSSVPKAVKPPPQQVEPLTKPKLKKLIEGAEEIAHSSPSRKQRIFPPLLIESTRSKSKVTDWMRRGWDPEVSKSQGESCDASGEYTTEEEGHSAHSSGDFNTSIINCHQSTEILPTLESPVVDKPSPSTIVSNSSDHFKMSPVVLRAKKKDGTPKRPLSESGLPQMFPIVEDDKLLQSRSESALNQIHQTPAQSVKMDMYGTLSSSTTVEEMPSQTQEGSGGGYSSNSLRRRKLKMRKRNLGRKSDSGSDGHDPPSPLKCGPAIRRIPTSGTETEEEGEGEGKLRSVRRKLTAPPMFRLGPENGAVTVFNCGEKILSAESSYSEQAWDNYQEKYMSEAYSEETPDQEATRRLLEFGDDYRNYIDSQSDGASSLGLSRPPVFNRRRRKLAIDRESLCPDSDSEGQEVRNLISKSQSHLNYTEQVWTRLSNANPILVMAKDFAEIISSCQENIVVLKILENVVKDNEFVEECREIRGLVERWESLEGRSEELQKVRSLQREMAALREELLELTRRVTGTVCESDSLQDRDQLNLQILNIKGEQANLSQRKKQLEEINTAVHRFYTYSGQRGGTIEAAARLEDDVTDLDLIFDETNKRVNQQLERLTLLSAAWQLFESHLADLQGALRGDQNTLRLLHSALQQGPVSQDVASSVFDVAKVLSDKQDLCFQNVCPLNYTTPVILSLPASTEGSLSDSGIGESGSEQESERERRLSALRRLIRQMAALSPNSQAIRDMTTRIEQTENELRGLQKTSRELIVRTALCADAKIQQDSHIPSSTLVNKSRKESSGPQSFLVPDDDDDDPGPGKRSTGWLWRITRASLPFQIFFLAIFCVAYFMEPRCCEHINNLHFSLTPQLRYVRGPPPT